jgi:predicted HD phosphohydrolase
MNQIAYALDLLSQTATETFGEEITHLDHSLQVYTYICNNYPGDIELAVAGFWHDIGHSLAILPQKGRMLPEAELMVHPETRTVLGVMDHDQRGAELFDGVFSERVLDLIRLHTMAKRYHGDVGVLSDASAETLKQEGGLLSEDQRQQFAEHPRFQDAMRLREADDAGKDADFNYDNYGGRHSILLRVIVDTMNCSLPHSCLFRTS